MALLPSYEELYNKKKGGVDGPTPVVVHLANKKSRKQTRREIAPPPTHGMLNEKKNEKRKGG